MDDTSTKQKWGNVSIEMDLMEEVDKIVKDARDHGARRYFSRADFVRHAILRLLEDYSKSTKGKKVGEEIPVVAGK